MGGAARRQVQRHWVVELVLEFVPWLTILESYKNLIAAISLSSCVQSGGSLPFKEAGSPCAQADGVGTVPEDARFKWLKTLCKQVTFLSMTIKCQPTFFFLAAKCHPGIRSNNEWLLKPNYLCMLRKDKKDIWPVFTWRWKNKCLFP